MSTPARTAAARTGAAALALAAALIGAPPAAAQPLPLDPGSLPPAGPAAPLEPTTQRGACTTAAAVDDGQFPATTATPAAQRALDFAAAWPHSRGLGQTVAVIDTGVTPHPRLPHLEGGGDYVAAGDGTEDCDAHGTLVAGIIAAQPDPAGGDAFTGVAPDAAILSIRQSSLNYGRQSTAADPDGGNYGNVRTLAMAVRRAADLGATVINISEVACIDAAYRVDDRSLGAALHYAVDVKDVVVVVAAGNVGGGTCAGQNPGRDHTDPASDGWDTLATVATPAWYDDYVLTVGSVGQDGLPSDFSLAGPWVDVAAPGTGIVSLDPAPGGRGLVNAVIARGQAVPVQGTSYAAPYVAGTAALVRARFPHLNARQVMARITRTAHAPGGGWDPRVGHGVLDPVAAVTAELPASALAAPPPRAVDPRPAPLAPPRQPALADPAPRRFAMTAASVALTALGLGYLLSLPLRRRAGGRAT